MRLKGIRIVCIVLLVSAVAAGAQLQAAEVATTAPRLVRGAAFASQFDPGGLQRPTAIQSKISEAVRGIAFSGVANASRVRATAFNKIASEAGANKLNVESFVILADETSERGESFFIRTEVDTSTGQGRVLEKRRAGESESSAIPLPPAALAGFSTQQMTQQLQSQMDTVRNQKTGAAGAATESTTGAYAAIFVPTSQQNPPAGTTGANIRSWFLSKGKSADLFVAPNAKASLAWPYIKNGNRLYVLYYCCHGHTSAADMRPCYGTIMNDTEMFWW